MTAALWALKNWKVLAVVVLLASCWAHGYGVRGNMADRVIAALTASHEALLATIDATHRAALLAETERARAAEQQSAANIAAIDAYWTQEINDANSQAARDVAAARSGDDQLRDRFTCPSVAGTSSRMPEGTPGASVDNDSASGGLQREDAAFLVSESARADAITLQLSACQAIVTADRQ